jgi:hypothetical protein
MKITEGPQQETGESQPTDVVGAAKKGLLWTLYAARMGQSEVHTELCC